MNVEIEQFEKSKGFDGSEGGERILGKYDQNTIYTFMHPRKLLCIMYTNEKQKTEPKMIELKIFLMIFKK